MPRILISWVAINNDFTEGKLPVNTTGPNSVVHNLFWKYEYHLLLSSAIKIEDDNRCLYLVTHLNRSFADHKIETKAMAINDVIDVNEISGKINALLIGLQGYDIDIFISPGTPAMQVAWYLAHINLKRSTKLFQIRKPEHTKSKKDFEQVWVDLNQSQIPIALLIREELKNKLTDAKILITKSIRPIYDIAEKVAAADKATVLILGETGTGKEGLAKYIHYNSPRAKGPFIAVNCAAMGESLLESRLFGYAKGAHNMAFKDTPGLFEDAENGTIFLDEIGDISSYMQQSLLRVLQEKEVCRIGESKTRKINMRVIAATNCDLIKLCSEKKFRWDLYYRLSVVDLTLPSLKEIGIKETEELFNFILKKKAFDFEKKLPKINADLRKKIFSYPFPGNIRELENFVERLYSTTEDEISEHSLPKYFSKITKEQTLKLDDVIAEHVKRVYVICDGNIVKTAKVLGISPNTVKTKLNLK